MIKRSILYLRMLHASMPMQYGEQSSKTHPTPPNMHSRCEEPEPTICVQEVQ